MTTVTKIIGWAVLIITEAMLGIGFFMVTDKAPVIGYQVAVFFTIWAAVAGKNVIDLKRDQSIGQAPEGK